MIEKNGAVTLTQREIDAINNGEVPQDLLDRWGLSLEELRAIVRNQQYNHAGAVEVIHDILGKQ